MKGLRNGFGIEFKGKVTESHFVISTLRAESTVAFTWKRGLFYSEMRAFQANDFLFNSAIFQRIGFRDQYFTVVV